MALGIKWFYFQSKLCGTSLIPCTGFELLRYIWVQDVIDTLSDKYTEAGFVMKIASKTLVGNNIYYYKL